MELRVDNWERQEVGGLTEPTVKGASKFPALYARHSLSVSHAGLSGWAATSS
jgi:hypothetical protein